jgi:hypothetical protein
VVQYNAANRDGAQTVDLAAVSDRQFHPENPNKISGFLTGDWIRTNSALAKN